VPRRPRRGLRDGLLRPHFLLEDLDGCAASILSVVDGERARCVIPGSCRPPLTNAPRCASAAACRRLSFRGAFASARYALAPRRSLSRSRGSSYSFVAYRRSPRRPASRRGAAPNSRFSPIALKRCTRPAFSGTGIAVGSTTRTTHRFGRPRRTSGSPAVSQTPRGSQTPPYLRRSRLGGAATSFCIRRADLARRTSYRRRTTICPRL